jgi:4-amino-4-deoxy-L-arabinose transferase-like glycosyltransferase
MGQTALTSPLLYQQRALPASPLHLADKLLIIIFGCSLLLAGLGMRTLTRHEVLAAYPAREMLLYGHWIVPMYAGIPRIAKPPGMYWLLAGVMKIFGQTEFVARLPSALAGVATGLMIASFAARHYGRRIGIVSGLMVLTSMYVLIQARLAESDMLLTALVCAAMLVFADGPVCDAENHAPPRTFRRQLLDWRAILFYTLAGLTFLLKGGVGPAFIFGGTLVYAIVQRDRRAAYFLLNPIGLFLFLALVAAWPIAAYLKYPAIWQAWRFEQVGRLTGERGYQPFYYYLYSIPGSLLPWTPFMIVPAWVGWKERAFRRPLIKFFLCWFLPGVIVLSAVAFKHQHYAFPLLPPLAILGAIGLLRYIEHQHAQKTKLHRFAAVAVVIACVAAVIVVHVRGVIVVHVSGQKPPIGNLDWPITLIIAVGGIGGLIMIFMEYQRRLVGQLAVIFATWWIVVVLVQVLIIPLVDDYKLDADLARSANARIPDGQTIYIIDPEPRVEPHSAWYLRQPIRRFADVDDFLARAPAPQPLYVITNAAQSTAMAKHGTVQVLERCKTNPVTQKTRDLMLVSYVPK